MKKKIEVKNLTKLYGVFPAVNDISFSVDDQMVLGFLGPNGAGKTTVMKILTGFHYPSGGTALIDGISVDEDPLEVKKRIGYLPENVPLYGDMTVDEYLLFAAQARAVPKKRQKNTIDGVLELCGLKEYRASKIDMLSKGYRQRAGLAQAILHDPPILILDEPTAGLDPNQIIEIRSLIKELGGKKTVILSTHILQEAEAICSSVLIINEGRIAAQGRPDEIASSVKGGDSWELLLKGASIESIRNKLLLLGQLANVKIDDAPEGTVSVSFLVPAEESLSFFNNAVIFDWALEHNMKILKMNRKNFSIEDIFVKLTGFSETLLPKDTEAGSV